MSYLLEKNIVEIKTEYTTFLINIMTPFVYEGVKSVYNYALETHKKFDEKSKNTPSLKSPGILKIFQTCLKEIPSLNNNSIEIETNRIKEGSRCSDWFDDLIKAVVKSNIILLTLSNKKNPCEIIKEKYHDKVNTKDFIHKCYIEVARAIYNNPELFWHEFPSLEIKRNQRESYEIIKISIQEAIRKMLPIKLILMEYLKNDYVFENDKDISLKASESQYLNLKTLVNKDLYGGINKDVPVEITKDLQVGKPADEKDKVPEDYLQKAFKDDLTKLAVDNKERKNTKDEVEKENYFEEKTVEKINESPKKNSSNTKDEASDDTKDYTKDYTNSFEKKLTNINEKIASPSQKSDSRHEDDYSFSSRDSSRNSSIDKSVDKEEVIEKEIGSVVTKEQGKKSNNRITQIIQQAGDEMRKSIHEEMKKDEMKKDKNNDGEKQDKKNKFFAKYMR